LSLLLFSLMQPLVYLTNLLAILSSPAFAPVVSVRSPVRLRRSLVEVFTRRPVSGVRWWKCSLVGPPPAFAGRSVRLSAHLRRSIVQPPPAFAPQSVRSPARFRCSLIEAFTHLSTSGVHSLNCSLVHPPPAFASRSLRLSARLRRSIV
jgi:hypothetical protein